MRSSGEQTLQSSTHGQAAAPEPRGDTAHASVCGAAVHPPVRGDADQHRCGPWSAHSLVRPDTRHLLARPDTGHPLARLLGGAILLCGCLLVDHSTLTGRIVLPAMAVGALLLYRTRPARVWQLLLAGAMFYLPVVMLASPGTALKGLTATIIGLATASSLGTQGLHDAVLRIPLPQLVRLLLLQMLHQAEVLRRESLRIHQAVVVRGGVGGMRGVWAFAKAFPVAWLPRVLFRANQVGMAMDVRGYGMALPAGPLLPWSGSDIGIVVSSLAVASGAVLCSALMVL